MSLSQLLVVGRSVLTIKDGPARYKMTQQNMLPKFGSEKQAPARASQLASAQAEPAPVVAMTTVFEAPEPSEPSEPSGPCGSESALPGAEAPRNGTAGEQAGETDPGPARVAAFVEATRKLRPFGTWPKNPFGWLFERQKRTAAVQTELSLDLVKPVRNDLSDLSNLNDVRDEQSAGGELPAGRPPAGVSAPPVPRGKGRIWERLKARWFGGGTPNQFQRP